MNETSKTTSGHKIFGTFFLEGIELAIDVDHVQEVVTYPEDLTPMPLAPDFLEGVFNLRGVIVPIINLCKILQIAESEKRTDQRVAIVSFGSARVGLAFNMTGEILRPQQGEMSDFNYSHETTESVIKGAIKTDGGKRLIQIIDPHYLVKIKNLPHSEQEADNLRQTVSRKQLAARKKCITFNVSGLKMAFEMKGIHEILIVPEIQNSSLKSQHCLGITNLRGTIVPIVSFASLLDKPRSQLNLKDQKLIVLKLEDVLVGLMVDSVDSISSYTDDGIMSVPLFNLTRLDMFQGCLHLQEGNVFLLDHSKVLGREEINQITSGHSIIYKSEESESHKKIQKSRNVYITFYLHKRFGVPIGEVREIITTTHEVMEAPGMPSYVKGVLNLRGKLVTIIDTKSFYGIQDKKETIEAEARIMIFQHEQELYGLLVDSVESIQNIERTNQMKLPDILSKNTGTYEQDVLEVLNLPDSGALIVLNTRSLINRLNSAAV